MGLVGLAGNIQSVGSFFVEGLAGTQCPSAPARRWNCSVSCILFAMGLAGLAGNIVCQELSVEVLAGTQCPSALEFFSVLHSFCYGTRGTCWKYSGCRELFVEGLAGTECPSAPIVQSLALFQ
jgi:hypothetical protein